MRVFGLLRLDLEQEEDGHGDHGEAQHIARGDAQHTVHFAAGRHLGELPTAECVADEEADEEEQADSQLPQRGGEERRREEHGRIGASDGDEAQEEVEPMPGGRCRCRECCSPPVGYRPSRPRRARVGERRA